MAVTVTTRIEKDLVKDIKFFAKEEGLDRSTEVRRLLSKAIQQKKIDYALGKYKAGYITIGKAAEMASMHLREMMTLAAKEGIDFQYSIKDLEHDFKSAKNDS